MRKMFRIFPLVLSIFVLAGCAKKKTSAKEEIVDDGSATYFSMRDFIKDQWNLYQGQPYVLEKYVTHVGKTDSSIVPAFDVEWGEIMEIFLKTDIGHKKFLDKYAFNVIDEGVSFTRSYYYEAKDPELYTKTLQITTDPTNNKIKSIYVEASDDKTYPHTSVKLYYAPRKVVQIQEIRKPRLGSAKETRTEYRFPQDESSFVE